MKVIDVLNKIAKGEKVKPFEIYGEKYYVNEEGYINDRDGNVNWLIYDVWLNQEVEIIEEEKKIEKLDDYFRGEIWTNDIGQKRLDDNFEIFANKINQLIDVINDMRDKE
jgi:hypothetical protein